MTDRPDRARQLGAWLDAERAGAQPFSWYTNNCCHFADRWVRAATGHAVLWPGAADVAGPASARRRVPMGLEDHVSALWGCDAQPASLAQMGDVLLLPVPNGAALRAALGVCGGRVGWVQNDKGGAPLAIDLGAFALSWPLASRRQWAQAAQAAAA